MSTSRGQWISKRGQTDADAAIAQVLDRQPGEQVQQVLDTLIEESPYQARRPFSDASVEDLAQSMRSMGFQGVLIVRPHSDATKQRRGVYQLVYGHRRRAAWQRVCAERHERCLLPTVIREVSDKRMLTIGAQENLQREDLDPIEEAQIVAWHQCMFSEKNQAEIGAMLGKTSDWVSVRARLHKLPDELKERLHQRPRAISQILELAALAAEQPTKAIELADRVVNENLTLEAVRTLVRGYVRPQQRRILDRDMGHNRRGAATIVPHVTDTMVESPNRTATLLMRQGDSAAEPLRESDAALPAPPIPHGTPREVIELSPNIAAPLDHDDSTQDTDLLSNTAAALAEIAVRAKELPLDRTSVQALDQAERALAQIRNAITGTALAKSPVASQHYELVDTDLHDLLVVLLGHRPSVASLRYGQHAATTISLVLFIMPTTSANERRPQSHSTDVFIAVSGAGHGVIPLIEGIPVERVRNSLGVPPEAAIALAALIIDLARVQVSLR